MSTTDFDLRQYDEAYPAGIERTWWQVARKAIVARAFEGAIARTEQVLEVGCGTGILTSHLREMGWEVTGVELGAPQHGLLAPEHLMLGRDACDLPGGFRERITVLALFDVIEHVADAPAFLRNLLSAYPNAHRLVLTVPARQELWTTFDDHFGHFRRYDRDSLLGELSAAGLSVIWSSYVFHGLYVAIRLNNLLRGRKRAIRFHAPSPGVPAALNSIIGKAFSMEARLLPAGLPGSSIICVAQRA